MRDLLYYVLFKWMVRYLIFGLMWVEGDVVLFEMQFVSVRVVERGLGLAVGPRAMPAKVAYGQAACVSFLF